MEVHAKKFLPIFLLCLALLGRSACWVDDPTEESWDEDEEWTSEEGGEEGHCLWYGECPVMEDSGTVGYNCNYTGPAKPLMDHDAVQILQTYCPSLAPPDSKSPPLSCCSPRQLKTFASKMVVAKQMVGRCPSCFQNFVNIFCFTTCDPHQSRHMVSFEVFNYTEAIAVKPEFPNQTAYVHSVDAAVSEDFGNATIESCSSVQFSSSNDLALTALCGHPAATCTPEVLLTFVGSTPQAPFNIKFSVSNENVTVYDSPIPVLRHHKAVIEPMNYTTYGCYEAPTDYSPACSCQDCHAVCPPIHPPPPPPKPWVINGVDGWYVVFACIFAPLTVAFVAAAVAAHVAASSSHNSNGHVQGAPNYRRLGADDVPPLPADPETAGSRGPTPLSTETQSSCLERVGLAFERALASGFTRWGTFVASHPLWVIVGGVVVCAGLTCGILRAQVVSNPVKLWSGPETETRLQKNYFDATFMPFFRTEMVIVQPNPEYYSTFLHDNHPAIGKTNVSSVFNKTFLHDLLDIELALQNVTAEYTNGSGTQTVTLSDICYKPLYPDNQNCTVMSLLQYWQEDGQKIDNFTRDGFFFNSSDWIIHFTKCAGDPAQFGDTTPANMPCLSKSGAPVSPWVVLGGYEGDDYLHAQATILTISVNNVHDTDDVVTLAPTLAWEQAFLDKVKEIQRAVGPRMKLSYMAERSIQDEIARESNSDVLTILLSYIFMFVYVAIALGQLYPFTVQILVTNKICLGLGGVLIVLLSVSSSIGLNSLCGLHMTLIVLEVVPFLVLAVGVDNIFILVQAYQRDTRRQGETRQQQVGRLVGQVGPSMLLTSSSEALAFYLGGTSTMPAVRQFALYAATAVLLDFLLQVSVFVALLSLDVKREDQNRADILCCVRVSDHDKSLAEKQDGILYIFVDLYYSTALLWEPVRISVMVVFFALACFNGAIIHKLDIGLDQTLSMPSDSYVLDYFKALNEYLSVGSPMYFVVKPGPEYDTIAGQNMVCGSAGCPSNSLLGQVYQASLFPNQTRVAHPASSWVDDYFDWLRPATPGAIPCCRYKMDKATGQREFCPATNTVDNCTSCGVQFGRGGRPSPEDFANHLHWFLSDNPGTSCAKGGHAAYAAAVEVSGQGNSSTVGATYYMTYHTILKTSADYIDGLRQAQTISQNVSDTLAEMHGGKRVYDVFPYSVFYVYYEQYLTIVHDTWVSLLECLAAVFVVVFLLLGLDLWSALISLLTIGLIINSLFGFMVLWGISLNAVSLVNILMAVGISVEFCCHIMRAFAVSAKKTRLERAKEAVVVMGSSVLTGITITKLVGVFVLAFSTSQLFQVFYFRMYLGMVIFGSTHGLIFLPVLLSYVGPPLNRAREEQAAKHAHQQRSPSFVQPTL